jgi:hypothetical protein
VLSQGAKGKDVKPHKFVAIAGLAVAAAACGQGSTDNVMAADANALTPAEINAALGPETVNSGELNLGSNDMNGIGESVENSPAQTISGTDSNDSAQEPAK